MWSNLKHLLLLVIVSVSACTVDEAIKIKLKSVDGRVSFSDELPGVWNEVCVLPPYTTNETAYEILGSYHDVESRSGIYASDWITLLVTLDNGGVVGLFEVERNEIDLTPLGGNCYPRDESDISVAP